MNRSPRCRGLAAATVQSNRDIRVVVGNGSLNACFPVVATINNVPTTEPAKICVTSASMFNGMDPAVTLTAFNRLLD